MYRAILCSLAIACLGFAPRAEAQASVEAGLTLHADQPGPTINPNIYGQFAEHLGSGIYGGLWVGPDSRIPNTRGFRNDVMEALRALNVPVVRWPGGCFADYYNWRDGIGPRDRRPVTLNKSWGNVEENNAVGTHEFFDLAEMLDTETYISANVGSGTPQIMADWVEYITSPSNSTLARERRRNGRREPWRLHHLGVGNEPWGCGGNMRPDHYADLYRQYANFISAPEGNRPARVVSGGWAEDANWLNVVMERAHAMSEGYSLHYYTIPTGDWSRKGAAIGFSEQDWIATLRQTLRMEDLIAQHVAVMDRFDPEKRVGLYVDEWGTWYDPSPGSNPAFLVQENTLRDALVAAINLNIFHAHADRVRMANIAQMVNVLQAMIITDGARMYRTPTYHVFEMFIPFQGATQLPIALNAPAYELGGVSIPSVSASAARDGEGAVHLAFANLDPNRVVQLSATIVGAHGRTLAARILTAPNMDSRNSFDAPDALTPQAFSGASLAGDQLTLTLPAKSVVVISLR